MAQPDLVVIGASAGSLQALTEIVKALPRSLPATVLIVVHMRVEYDSALPAILARVTQLPVEFAASSEALRRGRIVIAPPDSHLLVDRKGLLLHHGPRENGFRPAIDPLFRSAARAFGSRVVGVILSGALDDGTIGLNRIKQAGGMAIVQDPDDALVPAMPLNAIRGVDVDFVLPSALIGQKIVAVTRVPSRGVVAMPKQRREPDPQNPSETTHVEDMTREFGPPSGLTCPDCGGALWEIKEGKLLRYRCHVGHQFLSDSLDAEQQQGVEGALWTAVRVLEERADLRDRMSTQAEEGGMLSVASGFAQSASEAKRQAATIRELLMRPDPKAAQPFAPARSKKATRRRVRAPRKRAN